MFFGKVRNPLHGLMLRKLLRQQSQDLLQRLWHRTNDDKMMKAMDNKNNIVGFTEIFVWSVDAETYGSYLGLPARNRLEEVDGRIWLPKIANLAVIPTARNSGVGRQLVEACITQARVWGK